MVHEEAERVIITPARIHINSVDMNGALGRLGVGLGFAITRPRVRIRFSRSNHIEVLGVDRESARRFVRLMIEQVGNSKGIKLVVEESIPAHVGLGSRTQVALACGMAVALSAGIQLSSSQIARIMGRSYFSGIGLAVFQKGGFVVDTGYTESNLVRKTPLGMITRFSVPKNWKAIIVTPEGAKEERLPHVVRFPGPGQPPLVSLKDTRRICHFVLVQLLPSLRCGDFQSFCEAISEISKLGYKAMELDSYGDRVTRLIDNLKAAGAGCAAMTSGGPTVYALTDKAAQIPLIEEAASRHLEKHGGGTLLVSDLTNKGVQLLDPYSPLALA